MTLGQLRTMLSRAYAVQDQAHATTLGASLAYYAAFSLSPLLLLLLGLAAIVFGQEAAQGQLAGELTNLLGPTVASAAEEVIHQADRTPASGPVALAVSIVMLLFGASGVFAELQTALNAIWGVEPSPTLGWWGIVRIRFLSFITVLGTCFLLLASLVVTAVLNGLAHWWTPASAAGGTFWTTVWPAVNTLMSLGVITLLFALIYKYLPDALVEWRDVWLGASVTALLFLLGRYLLAVYLVRAVPTSGYGAAGSLVVVLLWVYYTSQIFLFGAAFTRVHAELAGREVRPAPHAERVAVTRSTPTRQTVTL
jgi:membrane protein